MALSQIFILAGRRRVEGRWGGGGLLTGRSSTNIPSFYPILTLDFYQYKPLLCLLHLFLNKQCWSHINKYFLIISYNFLLQEKFPFLRLLKSAIRCLIYTYICIYIYNMDKTYLQSFLTNGKVSRSNISEFVKTPLFFFPNHFPSGQTGQQSFSKHVNCVRVQYFKCLKNGIFFLSDVRPVTCHHHLWHHSMYKIATRVHTVKVWTTVSSYLEVATMYST